MRLIFAERTARRRFGWETECHLCFHETGHGFCARLILLPNSFFSSRRKLANRGKSQTIQSSTSRPPGTRPASGLFFRGANRATPSGCTSKISTEENRKRSLRKQEGYWAGKTLL